MPTTRLPRYKIDWFKGSVRVWHGLYKRTWFGGWERIDFYYTKEEAMDAYKKIISDDYPLYLD